MSSRHTVSLAVLLCHPAPPHQGTTLSLTASLGGAAKCVRKPLSSPALETRLMGFESTDFERRLSSTHCWSQDPGQSQQRRLLEILRVRLYVDLDVSEDEHLRSGELLRGVSGTSLTVWTESPSLSLLRLVILREGKGLNGCQRTPRGWHLCPLEDRPMTKQLSHPVYAT